MTSHCRAALDAAGLPATPTRLSDALPEVDRVAFLTSFLGIAQKRCPRCDVVKPLDDFYPSSGTKGGRLGRRSWCKTCGNDDRTQRRRARRVAEQEAA